ncbi:MAG: hypothetical protein CL946_04000 [Ectothiorhodospiraceae bacterium]|nr:hypothetical protein [Ectothiorhodospiraceae bacterium]
MNYFFYDSESGEGIDLSESAEGELEEVLVRWHSIEGQPGSLLGVVCTNGTVVQFMWDDACTVTLDLPLRERHGSLQKESSFEVCEETLRLAFRGMDPQELLNLSFVPW